MNNYNREKKAREFQTRMRHFLTTTIKRCYAYTETSNPDWRHPKMFYSHLILNPLFYGGSNLVTKVSFGFKKPESLNL